MKMKLTTILFLVFTLSIWTPTSTAQDCDNPTAQIDLDANNVRARLQQGGSLWWDGSDGKYIFPKTEPGTTAVSALFAGGIWVSAIDPGGNLRLTTSTYDNAFWPGPFNATGPSDPNTCVNWDRFFVVYQEDIDAFFADWEDNGTLDNEIPFSLKTWPSFGNPFFFQTNGFHLPDLCTQLAPYFDHNGDGLYNPEDGDYPLTKNADQAIWWVFNDAGSDFSVQVEIQMMAYAYEDSLDAINNSTFYDAKIISHSPDALDSVNLSLWLDPDLGCYTDDFVGCIPEENMAIVYNADAVDGSTGCTCEAGVNTYCEEIPMIGIKVLSDPETMPQSLGLSSFITFVNGGFGNPPVEQTDPNALIEYFRLMTGRWIDGTPMLDPDGNETLFQYPDSPDDTDGWSMCTDTDVTPYDRRMLLNFGSFNLGPGAIQTMSFAIIGVEDVAHPCPGIDQIMEAANTVDAFFNQVTAGTEVFLPKTAASFSPNPVTGSAILKLLDSNQKINTIRIFNSEGKLVIQEVDIHDSQYIFSRNNLPAGMYVYKLFTTDGSIALDRFIIQ